MDTKNLKEYNQLTDDKEISIQYDNTYNKDSYSSYYIRTAMQSISLFHAVLWVSSILIAISCTVWIISILPWYNSTFPQNYFKLETYILLEDIFQPFLLSIIASITTTIMYAPEFTFLILIQTGIPIAIFFLAFWIITYWLYDLSLTWYDIDGPIMCVQYILTSAATIYRLANLHRKKYNSNNNHTTYNKWKLFKYVVIPTTWLWITVGAFGGPGLEFYLSLSAKYQFLFRTLVWPPLIQFTLNFAERLFLKVRTKIEDNIHNNSSKLHAVLVAQSILAIFGRVMIFSGKNLTNAILLAIGHVVQEILFHRWSRQMSRVNFEFRRRCLNKICCCNKCRYSVEMTFEEYFNSDRRKDFRSYTINIEYMIELVGIISTSLMFILFYKYRYVFNFDYPLKDDGSGVDIQFVILIAGIQMLFEMISYGMIVYIENRFNGVQLLNGWTKLNHLQMITSLIIMVEAVISAATVTRSIPNVVQCTDKNNVCSCSFATDWNGC